MRRGSLDKRVFTNIGTLLLIVLSLSVSCQNRANKEELYGMRIGEFSDVILAQSSACLNQSKAYTAAWEYAKVTGEDFNSAARHILGPERAEAAGRFAQNRIMIADYLEKVENPPEKYKSSYEKLIEMHKLYLKLNDVALKPTAPQEEYEASVNKLYDGLLKRAGELNALLGR
jgi:Asp-tRNA(Asn)/Glu-tRNA(Gln) amidotransferase A subunit family amidase